MTDMNSVITPKSDQLNADSLLSGPRIIRVTEVLISPGTEQPVTVRYEDDDGKPWKPCKSMSRVLVFAWGPDAKAYAGRYVELYLDPSVKWGGMAVGGVRISRMSHLERDLVIALTATKGKKAMFTVKPLVIEQKQAAPVVPELTLDAARTLVEQAPDMAALEQVWKRKAMAPFRDELGDALAFRKTELTAPQADDGEAGE